MLELRAGAGASWLSPLSSVSDPLWQPRTADAKVYEGADRSGKDQAAEVLTLAQEIDARELEQAKLIIAEKSLRKGLAKYGRI